MIRDFMDEYGIPPTRMEIATELKFKSPNSAEEHLRALQKKGVIELIKSSSRGIRLKDSLREQIGLPLIGQVAAGNPVFSEENFESYVNIDPNYFSQEPHYLLRINGMSMKDAGIFDNDIVAVHRTSEIRSRQIVVARINDEVTVKRYTQNNSIVTLLPENDEFLPIEVDLESDEMVIEGIVVGVLRSNVE
tara:strand:+ start:717 stop:1289 length:573 start_codon:yes stop_codon:yes gene_type:complete